MIPTHFASVRGGKKERTLLFRIGPSKERLFPAIFLRFLPPAIQSRFSLYWGNGFYVTEIFAEIIFFVFILLALGGWIADREAAGATVVYAMFYAALWVAWLGLARWSSRISGLASYIRGFGPWIAVMLSYNLVGKIIRLVHPTIYDDQLQGLSGSFGMNPADGKARFLEGQPGWVDFFSLLYLGLFAWLFLFLFYYSLRKRFCYQGLMLGLMLIYAVGFLGYLLYPAQGPRYAHPEQWLWLQGGWAFKLMNGIVSHMGAKWDVFPSLHAAISIYLLSWQWTQHKPFHRLWAVPLASGIWISTLLLGFHYALDLMGGGLLGGMAFLLSLQGGKKFGNTLESPRFFPPG